MQANLAHLKHIAYNLRVLSLKATTAAGSGHPTSALSAADMIAAIFFHAMRYDWANPYNPRNDRFILSKGHASPVLYAAWEQAGVITEQELMTLRQFNSVLEGHPTPRFIYDEAATGSLGNGLSIGLGMALSARLSNLDFRVYVMMGDSEMAEGSIWEGCELAAYYKADNLIGLIDVNRLGQSTQTMEGYDLENYRRKLEAFGWHTFVIDGHDMAAVVHALDEARNVKGRPSMIIAHTYKGHGLNTNIEGKEGFHGKAFSHEQLPGLLQILEQTYQQDASSHFEPYPSVKRAIVQPKHSFFKLPSAPYKTGEKMATRKAYGQTLKALGGLSPEVVSLDAEVKNSTFAEIFEHSYPQRFFQCFVAEQNLVNMAIGFATRGYIPFVSTFGAFFTRAHDQIRMAAIGRAPLRLAGSHCGVSIGQDGPSQMALEDIAQMRALPNSIVLYPSDATSTFALMNLMVNYYTGISYIRLTRSETTILYNDQQQFTIGGCNIIRQTPEDKVCIIAAGITLYEALKAYELLKQQGIACTVIDLYCVKPLAEDAIRKAAIAANRRVVTVEDHFIEGGLGETVCYALRNDNIHIEVLAVRELSRSGKPEELLAFHRIDSNAIISCVSQLIRS